MALSTGFNASRRMVCFPLVEVATHVSSFLNKLTITPIQQLHTGTFNTSFRTRRHSNYLFRGPYLGRDT